MFALHVIDTPRGEGRIQLIERADGNSRDKETLTKIINFVFYVALLPARSGVAKLAVKTVLTLRRSETA